VLEEKKLKLRLRSLEERGLRRRRWPQKKETSSLVFVCIEEV